MGQNASIRLKRSGETLLPRGVVLLLLAVAVCTPLALYRLRLAKPAMAWDDFPFVRDAITWERTRAAIWKPFATHLCPPFRLLTWALVARAEKLSAVPETLRLGWIVGHVLTMLTLYQFVSGETRSAASGLAAVLLAGVTTAYFPSGVGGLHSCSIFLWSMMFTLIVLLCLQSSRESFRPGPVVGAAAAAALAPAWSTPGLVAGPLGSLYIALSASRKVPVRQRVLMTAVPTLGTCLFASLALAIAGKEILDPENFDSRPVLEVFRPDIGLYLTARVVSEHLLWNLGIHHPLDVSQFLVFLTLLIVLSVYWFRRAQYRPLAVCGLVLMLGSYVLVYSFRSYMDMMQVRLAPWYLFFPHVGWAIFISAGISAGVHSREEQLSLAGAVGTGALGLALFLLHGPVAGRQAEGLISQNQLEQLIRLELVEQVSRSEKVDRWTLQDAIGPFRVSGADGFDSLSLIDPPDTGRVWDPEDVRRRLEAVLESGSVDAFGGSSDSTRRE